jgi:hypothetical protein
MLCCIMAPVSPLRVNRFNAKPIWRNVMRIALYPALAALAVLAGCATAPVADVTRFHLGQPIPGDSLAIVPATGMVPGLAFDLYASVVARDLAAAGFHPGAAPADAAYLATLKVEQTSQRGLPRPSPFRIGIGGGSYSHGIGLGGQVSLPVGKPRPNELRVNFLSLQIRRRSDSSIVWEGRATDAVSANAAASALTDAVPVLSHALLAGFPGPSGQTVKVKTGK